MGNDIPTKQRALVRERDRDQCGRCGRRGSEFHHRRSRRVRDSHTHCSCVGILLCAECHRAVHASPAAAREKGFIVSMHEAQPWTVGFRKYDGTTVYPSCDGGLDYTPRGAP